MDAHVLPSFRKRKAEKNYSKCTAVKEWCLKVRTFHWSSDVLYYAQVKRNASHESHHCTNDYLPTCTFENTIYNHFATCITTTTPPPTHHKAFKYVLKNLRFYGSAVRRQYHQKCFLFSGDVGDVAILADVLVQTKLPYMHATYIKLPCAICRV